MIAAECSLQKMNDPLKEKIPKAYKCPPGQVCIEKQIDKACKGKSCKKVIFEKYSNTIIKKAKVLKTVSAKDETDCIEKCLKNQKCRGFVFDLKLRGKQCSLMEVDQNVISKNR